MKRKTIGTGFLIAFFLLIGVFGIRNVMQEFRKDVADQTPTKNNSPAILTKHSFSKLDAQGAPLGSDAPQWAMVRDNVTGLVWEVKTRDGSIRDCEKIMTWHKAKDLINGLNSINLGGFSDWRLPTREELRTIVDYRRTNPAIDLEFFPNTVPSYYWSTTRFTGQSPLMWCINFQDGSGYHQYHVATTKYVRAVRGRTK